MSNTPDGSMIPILYQDDTVLVANKPAGLPTLPGGWEPAAPCLLRILADQAGRLWTVHRLDRHTSGVILLARSAEAHRALNLQFERREVAKMYHALVRGVPSWDERSVTLPLRVDGDRKHRTVVDQRRGKPAVTHLRVLARFALTALVEAKPETGRTHQIRAHLAALELPLVADVLYGGSEAVLFDPGMSAIPVMERPALHAASLAFRHPVTGERILIEAPRPADLAAAVQRLQAYS